MEIPRNYNQFKQYLKDHRIELRFYGKDESTDVLNLIALSEGFRMPVVQHSWNEKYQREFLELVHSAKQDETNPRNLEILAQIEQLPWKPSFKLSERY